MTINRNELLYWSHATEDEGYDEAAYIAAGVDNWIPWHKARIQPDMAVEFLAMGISPTEAWDWNMTPDLVRNYASWGFDAEEAREWLEYGYPSHQAMLWRESGFSPVDALAVAAATAVTSQDDPLLWVFTGFSPARAYDAANRGDAPSAILAVQRLDGGGR